MDIDEPLFQPYPSDITFQKFEPFNTYEVPLLLRNNDKVSVCLSCDGIVDDDEFQVARAVKVSQVDTPYFSIIAPANAYQKVAPGVALVFRIQFKPEEQRVCLDVTQTPSETNRFVVGLCT